LLYKEEGEKEEEEEHCTDDQCFTFVEFLEWFSK
jgi:hypothetical protein